MANPIYGPIIKIEYATAGTSFSSKVDLGEINDQSSHSPEVFEDTKNPRGEVLYTGGRDNYTFNVYDTTKRAALMTAWKSASRQDFRLTFEDGGTLDVLDVLPQCGKVQYPTNAGQKAMWTLTINKMSIE